MRKRIAYSQNFLKDKALIANLIAKSAITTNDVVYEIGAGQGIITEELLKRSRKVVAFEIDENLFRILARKFTGNKSLDLIHGNFLTYSLPSYPYKVFSNIPFNITSDVIKKLTQAPKPPDDAFLIVQNEAAKKFIGKPHDSKNSQMAILLRPWFELEISHKFNRDDFSPKPQVETVLLKINKRKNPLIKDEAKSQYQDFIVYTFNQFKPNVIEGLSDVFGKQTILNLARTVGFSTNSKPSQLDFNHWFELFNFFEKTGNKALIRGSYARILEQQNRLEKVHRTRVDKNWKQFRKK
jgi:23S rRNA (adenine-N6)-dimethyltransferase